MRLKKNSQWGVAQLVSKEATCKFSVTTTAIALHAVRGRGRISTSLWVTKHGQDREFIGRAWHPSLFAVDGWMAVVGASSPSQRPTSSKASSWQEIVLIIVQLLLGVHYEFARAALGKWRDLLQVQYRSAEWEGN